MPRNQFGFGRGFKLINLYGPTGSNKKRTLGIREKQILYHRAKGRCEAHGGKIDFSEM